jgi:uncharacterized membrane protein
MNKGINYFLQGILYIAPIAVTGYIIYLIVSFTDNLLKDLLTDLFNIHIPGLGFVVVILLLVFVGFIGQSIIARPVKVLFKRILMKSPLLKVLFSAFNDLFSAFVGKEKRFNKPVLVMVNSISNLEKVGFITEEDLSRLGVSGKVAVYFPHSYNFSGELFIVPKENVKPLDIHPAEVMKFIVSAGVSGWDKAEG